MTIQELQTQVGKELGWKVPRSVIYRALNHWRPEPRGGSGHAWPFYSEQDFRIVVFIMRCRELLGKTPGYLYDVAAESQGPGWIVAFNGTGAFIETVRLAALLTVAASAAIAIPIP